MEKKIKISKWDWIAYAFCLAVFVFLGYSYIRMNVSDRSLAENLVHAEAVVIDDFSTFKYDKYFGYEFSVNGKTYRDKGKYYPSDSLLVGDTVAIVYDGSDPDVSWTYRGYVYHQKEKPFIIPILIGIVLLTWWRVRRKKT